MVDHRPGHGRYAHLEREQRWIASGVPDGARYAASIVDRYIIGTRLRLRRSETQTGIAFKLGQKVRVRPADPEMVRLTNVYLSAEEHDVLTALPAAELRKVRWHVDGNGRTVAIDQFDGRLDGLVLAEVELAAGEDHAPPPPFVTWDITHDDRFSGGALAFSSDAALEELLHEANEHKRRDGGQG